ncbi:hypothetical protein ACZ90_40030 [Streptomyces albus subsp. albus]|nr:hypothetical protein ACZ90_40030 [Streptomyces albus subsp. albus]
MAVWRPDPGEILLARAPVMFAAGAATAVSGMRWFRDTERRDIQHELPGWPAGPVFTPRSAADRRARGVLAGVGRTVGAVVLGILAGGVGDVSTLGRPQDPANEVEDFPVLWGAPGSIARTLPWQLDPARRGPGERTHLIVTDRRVLIVALRKGEHVDDQLLWQADRAYLARVEPKDFSAAKCEDYKGAQTDVRIDFTDGSWCRLASNYRESVCRHLTYPLVILSPGEFTPGQRQRVEGFAAGRSLVAAPVVTRLPDFNYLIEARESEEVSWFSGIAAQSEVMGPDGGEPQR